MHDSLINPLFPERPPWKFSSQFQLNISQTGIENEDNYQLDRCDLDITANSHGYLTKKYMVLVRRMTVLILGIKGLRKGLEKRNMLS